MLEIYNSPQMAQNVLRIVVRGAFPILKNGLVIADTPGFGKSVDMQLQDYLGQSTSQVFWVVIVEQGITGLCIKNYNDVFGNNCSHLIITGCNNFPQDKKDAFRALYAGLFQSKVPEFHFVSGQKGIEAKTELEGTELAVALNDAGITKIENVVKKLDNVCGRFETFAKPIRSLAEDLEGYYLNGKRRPQPGSW
jgi:hypothetical protein